MNHLVWLFYGKEPLFGDLVPGAGRRCICNPADLFLSRAAGKLCSRCSCQAEGALPHKVAFLGCVVQNQREKHGPCCWNVKAGGMDAIGNS